jgi:hypothetical protein
MQALIHSSAIDSALGQILSLPEPSAMQQKLASFLDALMHGQAYSITPGTLAAAVVRIAASAKKNGGQVCFTCLATPVIAPAPNLYLCKMVAPQGDQWTSNVKI